MTTMTETMVCRYCNGTGWDEAFSSDCYCTRVAVPHRASVKLNRAEEKVQTERLIDGNLIIWLRTQTKSSFAQSLVAQFDRTGSLSPRQREAAQNMKAKATATPAAAMPGPRVTTAAVPEGIHMVGDRVFRVKLNQAKTNRYATELVGTEWVYDRAHILLLSAATLVTKEQAAGYGRRTGVCCICGITLTDPKSIAAGIGPICASKF